VPRTPAGVKPQLDSQIPQSDIRNPLLAELLTVRGLSRRYGERLALAGLDLRLVRGEVLGLLGPNGAGKTTCLQVLSGNLAPSGGEIRVLGEDLLRHPLRAKRHIGYLPERPPLYPDMRLDEYLAYCARLHRVPRRARAEAVSRTMARCGLEGMGRRLLGRLSKGYRQRVGIAQAIVHGPDLVILDEPTDGLDPVQIREVRDLIRALAAECGLILSSHILSQVQAVCTRVLILRDGRVLHQARLDEGEAAQRLGRYRVRLVSPPPLAALTGLPGVAAVQALDDGAYRLTLRPGEPTDALAARLVEGGFGLAELVADGTDLERVFFDILGGGEPA
jgi:ABC-2 type transport system ATP-binding protein